MFFFFKQKTAYEMRICDWSSDVCSSDLGRDSSAGLPEGLPHRKGALHGKGMPNPAPPSQACCSITFCSGRQTKGQACPPLSLYPAISSPAISSRSEARSVGKECVSTCRTRGLPDH